MTKGISDFKALQSLRNNKQQSNPSSEDIKLSEELGEQIRKLSDIGRALSGVHDLNILLEMIVDQARSFTNADAGTLYIVENNTLRFQIVQNDSLKSEWEEKPEKPFLFPRSN